jgi:hypothetical protein
LLPARIDLAMNPIWHRVILGLLLIAALALIWNVLGAR